MNSAVDDSSPWLGLASFTEETRSYFHGREEEVAELGRRVQRKLLTVLFGQSGLGKTSILRAGLVPRLRPNGYCPVYVRIDYAPESPPPAEQIKQAIFRATGAEGGHWTQPGSAVAGESLWEFLHHRDDLLKDEGGNTVVPLLIFDQFEEIFTIAQSDSAVRQRAAEFLAELADLVENRPPRELEARLESDDSLIARFDFSRADYRILISLREDYLAHLEGVKASMPSITQNRMRIARMTGDQALAAVTRPGGKLVTQEVAESIVRFVAGGAELRNAEVEPALLSLICRELNNARISQGRSEITADLLAGSHDTILGEFYERALADQPQALRHFIEDSMLTDSGYRESLAEERVLKAFAAAGAAPDALAALVNRRLLRVEERLDVRRVELTHDVLCAVVKSSRDARHEREAREAAQRQLAEQKTREENTRSALARARRIAAGCAVLALVAIAGAVFGWINMNRAREAQATATDTRQLAETARVQAEKLVVYLLDDFYLELEPIGRLDIVADLSKRAIAYYDALPPPLRTSETIRNRALAQMRLGAALRTMAKVDESEKALNEVTAALEKLRAEGDKSEGTALGLGGAYAILGRIGASRNQMGKDVEMGQKAVDVLKPVAEAPNASVAARRTYAQVLSGFGFSQQRSGLNEEAIKTLDASREMFRGIDGLKLGDLAAAAGFAEATAWQLDALMSLNRFAEAPARAQEGIRVATSVLEQRPVHMNALRARALLSSGLASVEGNSLRLAKALAYTEDATRDWETFVRLDPANSIAWNNLGANYMGRAATLEGMGRPEEAARAYNAILEIEKRAKFTKMPALLARNIGGPALGLVRIEADMGNSQKARAAMETAVRMGAIAVVDTPPESFVRGIVRMWPLQAEYDIAEAAGDLATMRESARLTAAIAQDGKPTTESGKRTRFGYLSGSYTRLALVLLRMRDYAGAEAAARKAVEFRRERGDSGVFEAGEAHEITMLHAVALARLGRLEEARKVVAPAVAFFTSLPVAADEPYYNFWMAGAKYAQAVTTPAEAQRLLAEAQAHLDSLPKGMARLKSTQRLRDDITREQKARA